MSRRRHSSRRATTWRQQRKQLASMGMGMGSPKGDKNKHDRVEDFLRKHRQHVQRGNSMEDIVAWRARERENREARWRTDPDIVSLEREQVKKRMKRYSRPTLGTLPSTKPTGFKRFCSIQLNGIAGKIGRRVKIEQIRRLVEEYDIDMVSLQEVGINWNRLLPSETLSSFFSDMEVELRSVTAHNSNEGKHIPCVGQYGGTGLLSIGGILQYTKRHGKDFRGLGRWCWYTLEGSPEYRTRVLTAYHVGQRARAGEETVYQQHLRYMEEHDIGGEPYDMFCADLLHQLQVWRHQGDKIILQMDANEHVLEGPFTSALREEVGLEEISHRAWRGTPPHTFIDGSQPIDGVWASPELDIGGFAILSFGQSVGDHSTLVFDVGTRSIIGRQEDDIVRPECRRLNTQTSSLRRYNEILEAQMARHKMQERLDELLAAIEDDTPTPAQAAKMEALDRQFVEIQLHAERHCRKIRKPLLQFSPEVKLWYERMQAYKALLRWKKGNARSSNIIRTALRRGIQNPRDLSIAQMEAAVNFTRAEYRLRKANHVELRRQHQREMICAHEAKNKPEAAKRIKRQMDREGNKKMWYFINRAMKDPHRPAPHYVQRMVDGVAVESTSQSETEAFIFGETEVRFHLAADAPISQTQLIHQLGYLADTQIAEQIIEGTYEAPDDVDDATALILDEIGKIGVRMKNGGTTIDITPEEFRYFWRRIREKTASSKSGVHYGHYKAAAHSAAASTFLANKITLIARCGVPPERWSYGLTVMLEKIAGLALVSKLRAILLMEADFNMHNKLYFGKRMLDRARDQGIIPGEQYSDKQSTADDGTFDKILQSDIGRQRRLPFAIISADAANCYDRINHAIMALLFLALGVQTGTIRSMLRSIQLMKFFLRTGWGESTSFIGGDPSRILHGMCQGNGASPAAWLVLSAVIVASYKSLGFGCKMRSPITKTVIDSMGVLYVDDTDLYIMHECLRTPMDVWDESQQALDAWGKLLISTGGMLKPDKCFYYLMDFEFADDGSWQVVDVVSPDLLVPQMGGQSAPIRQRPATDSQKTLGLWTNPAGDCSKQLAVIKDKVADWTDRLAGGKLPARWGWVSYSTQLWARLRYGLGCNASGAEELISQEAEGGDLRPLYRRILPLLGVNRNIKAAWRHLPTAFGGIGLKRLFHEAAISRVNLFMQHYSNPSMLGKKLTMTLEALQIEAGFNCCPLSQPYSPIGPLLTPSWARSFWECLDRLQWGLHVDYPSQPLPREQDKLLLDIFLRSELAADVLLSLTRCRNAWCVLFLSDITAANGRTVEPRFYGPAPPNASAHSTLTFPREQPSATDWQRWESFWRQYCGSDRALPVPLGRWLHRSHRVWEFFYDADRDLVEQVVNGGVAYYLPEHDEGILTRGRRHYRYLTRHIDGRLPTGFPCTADRLTADVVSYISHGPRLLAGTTDEQTFFEFLRTWGGEWMWANIGNDGTTLDWVVSALSEGTAIWVTDGSYNRETAPHVSGAGWVLYCTATGKRLYGNFYEFSEAAGSYRGELLGLLAIHVLAAAFESFYDIHIGKVKICCDNKGALYKSAEQRRRIPTGASQADIKRVLRNVKGVLRGTLQYEWVPSHQDRYKLWNQLPIEQQLNCMCDTLAKKAVADSLFQPPREAKTQLLPKEKVAVIIDGVKQTSDVARAARFHLGRNEAEKIYTAAIQPRDSRGRRPPSSGLGWSKDSFNAVDWRTLSECLSTKPQMYQQWLSKQSSGFCGTQDMVARWDAASDGKCPNCRCRESAAHLMLCPDRDRTRLLHAMADELQSWLSANHGHRELVYWIPRYIKLRGTRRLGEMPRTSVDFQRFASQQDLIPWRAFMEGKVSKALFRLQETALTNSPSNMSIDSWAKKFTSHLLHITHGQWVFRNVTLHDASVGYRMECRRAALLQEIDKLSSIDPRSLPEGRRYLLEMDFSSLLEATAEKQSYWLVAVKAAVKAGRRSTRRAYRLSGRFASSQRGSIRQQQPRAQVLDDGAEEVWRGIEISFGLRAPVSRKRGTTTASRFVALPDNKRRRPD